MSFSFPFGQPEEGYPFFPPPPPLPAMPWAFPSMAFQIPPPQIYPQQVSPFFPPRATPNLFVNQQSNSFYAFAPSCLAFGASVCPPSFQKSREPPKPPAKLVPARNGLVPARNGSEGGRCAAAKQKGVEVIQISDDECEGKKEAGKRRKCLVSKEQRVLVELKRLSNRRFVKLDDKDREDLQKQLKSMAEKIGAQPKRSKRVGDHLSRQYRESKSFLQFEDSRDTRKTPRKTLEDKPFEEASGLNNFQPEINLSRILRKQQFSQQKRTLKQGLLLRSVSSL